MMRPFQPATSRPAVLRLAHAGALPNTTIALMSEWFRDWKSPHCTGYRGACGNNYIREEDLARLLGELVKQVRIPTELTDGVANVLRESQSDKEQFVRTTMMRLQQQQLLLTSKLDRAYDDRLSGRISDELWTSKSAELEAELQRVRAEMGRHEHARRQYETTGLQILELAQSAYSLYVTQNPQEQARLVKTLLSNCTFDRGSLSPTYNKPFDLFVKGAETQEIGSSG